MARLPRGLWIVLILWLMLSRPSAASRTESPYSAQWWGAEEFSRIEKSAKQLRVSGNFEALQKLYVRAVDQARRTRNTQAQTAYLTALGNTYLILYRYTEAIQAYGEAWRLARSHQDWLGAGAVTPGLSSVHFLIGDWAAARKTIEDGLEAAQLAGSHPYYEAQLQIQRARLSIGEPDLPATILEAIEAARMQPNPGLEAEGWDLLGEQYQKSRKLELADAAFTEAHRLRRLLVPRDLRLSYWRLGALRLEQGRLREADQLTARAILSNAQAGGALSAGTLLHQRGQIRVAAGDTAQGLEDFIAAVRIAERWRMVVPPASRDSLTAADTELDRSLSRSLIETAARQALKTGELRWAEVAFLAAERNRAASLRQSSELAKIWRRKLPSRYWDTLARLRAEESRTLQEGIASKVSAQLHLELSEMEAAAGLGHLPKKMESLRPEDSLSVFQQGLSNSELFLSFYTGTEESYLWAVTRNSFHLYLLPGAGRIEEIVAGLKSSVMQQRSIEAQSQAFSTLLGQLDERERKQPVWLLSLDGALFDLPFAAMRVNDRYLVESHSIQRTPGAALLRRRSAPGLSGSYLGVGDPVYNSADARFAEFKTWNRPPQESPGQMNRLVGSADEVRRSAKEWSGPSSLLTGANASRERILDALNTAHPATIHFATHVVTGEAARDQFYLALSLGANGSPELLGTAEIGMLHVPGALVVMTGCDSGTGQARAGAGQLGLTRAWLTAGADNVIAMGWPVEDTRGDLVSAFYRELSNVSTAEALRRAQVEMIHSGTWRADPAYWAAFQLTGGVR